MEKEYEVMTTGHLIDRSPRRRRPKQYKALTDEQMLAVKYLVDDGLNYSEIGRQVGRDRNVVRGWFQRTIVKQAVVHRQKEIIIDTRPKHILEFVRMRDKAIEILKTYLGIDGMPRLDLKVSELVKVIEVCGGFIDKDEDKMREPVEDAKSIAKQFLEANLTKDELEKIARRLISGKPITTEEDIRELESPADEGDYQEGGAG